MRLTDLKLCSVVSRRRAEDRVRHCACVIYSPHLLSLSYETLVHFVLNVLVEHFIRQVDGSRDRLEHTPSKMRPMQRVEELLNNISLSLGFLLRGNLCNCVMIRRVSCAFPRASSLRCWTLYGRKDRFRLYTGGIVDQRKGREWKYHVFLTYPPISIVF